MRLGLSDSMRSVSLEDTEPLHTATHRRAYRRSCVKETSCSDGQMKQNSKTERLYKAPKTTLRIIMGVILLVTSFAALSVSLRAWKPSNSQFDEQFEQLERRFSLLGRATARLETSASRFLKNCQNVQIAAKVRTEMLANSAKKSFEEQAQAEVEEQEQVMKEVMEYYTQQEQQIQETKQRLLAMNITLPVQVTVRPVPDAWQNEDQQLPGLLEGDEDQWSLQRREGHSTGPFADAMMGLSLFAKTNFQQSASKDSYPRLSVETISIQTGSDTTSRRQTITVKGPASHRNYGSFLFYVVVACISVGYLWKSITDTRKTKLLHDKWSWSPVPRILRRLKAFISSLVVIEDLRKPGGDASKVDGTAIPLEHIEFYVNQ